MTFKHTYESVIGDARERVVVVVGDIFADIVDIDAATEVRVIEAGKTKTDLDVGGGKFTQDTLGLTINEVAALTSDDQDAIALILSAAGGVKVYVAVFVNPPASPTMTDTVFFGIVDAKIRQSDRQWFGEQWSTNAEPLRELKLTAKSFSASILGDLAPETVFDGNDEIDGVLDDAAWIAANVQDRDFLEDNHGGSHWNTWKTKRLVSLTALIDKMLEVTELLMREELSENTITISRTSTATSAFTMWLGRALENTFRIGMQFYQPLEYSSSLRPEIGTAGGAGDPYVHFGLLDDSAEDKEVSFRRFKSMHSLLASIANGFGFFLQANWTSPTDLELEFVPRGEIVGNGVFIQDATKATRDYTSVPAKNIFTGKATRFSPAGWGAIRNRYQNPDEWYSNKVGDGVVTALPNGDSQLALTVSPTQMVSSRVVGGLILCINPTDDEGVAEEWHCNEYVHSGLWFKESDKFRQAAFVSTIFDGEEIGYQFLSGLLNRIHGHEDRYFEDTYDITALSLTGFSANSDGSARAWNALGLGSAVTIDGGSYTVVSIERDLAKFETRLKLHRVGRFDYGISAKTPDQIASAGSLPSSLPLEASPENWSVYLLGDVAKDDIVAMSASGAIRAEACAPSALLPLAIALESGAAGQTIGVQLGGLVELSGKSLAAGEHVYLRTTSSPSWNGSTSLAGLLSEETVFRAVGSVVDTDTLLLDPREAIFTSRGMLL